MTHHNLVSDKEMKDKEKAAVVDQGDSGIESLPAMQDTASIPSSEEKIMKQKGKKDSKKGGKGSGKSNNKTSSGGYTGLNKYRPDMLCSSCGRSMIQTGAITTEEIAVTKRLAPRADGKPPYKPMPGIGANRALAVVCDDCIRQNKPPEEGGTNMPITYKTAVVMTYAGKVINVPVNSLK